MAHQLKFSIAIPTYNGASLIGETLRSILSQSFQNFEIVISDDCSKDNTLDTIRQFRDERIRVFENRENLGYGKNLQVLKKLVRGDTLFLMGQDDILLKDALLKTARAFQLGKEIGAVVRPYYWFDGEDVLKPVRVVAPYDPTRDRVISIFDGRREVEKIFEAAGQLSGLAYRLEYMDIDFGEETFPAHIYPLASITKKYKVVFLKDYTVAVRSTSSQTRFKPSIYKVSPAISWARMFKTVYGEKKYEKIRKAGIEQVARHYLGLVQIKNYSPFINSLREIVVLVKLRPLNLISWQFWLYVLGIIFIPRRLLIWLVDTYKLRVLSRRLRKIEVEL